MARFWTQWWCSIIIHAVQIWFAEFWFSTRTSLAGAVVPRWRYYTMLQHDYTDRWLLLHEILSNEDFIFTMYMYGGYKKLFIKIKSNSRKQTTFESQISIAKLGLKGHCPVQTCRARLVLLTDRMYFYLFRNWACVRLDDWESDTFLNTFGGKIVIKLTACYFVITSKPLLHLRTEFAFSCDIT